MQLLKKALFHKTFFFFKMGSVMYSACSLCVTDLEIGESMF